jgi:uncharacterized membrane protein YczE
VISWMLVSMLVAAFAHAARRLGTDERPVFIRRSLQLTVGLIGFGVSLALMVRADLGLGPWDVLHQGASRHTGIEIGWIVIAVSVLVLILWIPLRLRPGLGTLANAILVGLSVNAALALLPTTRALAPRLLLLVVGIMANGAATGLYIGARLGPGPRDGLMTGLAKRGYSIRRARTSIELAVLALGWGLGGTVGVGTIAYALGIGPLAQFFIPKLTVAPDALSEQQRKDPLRFQTEPSSPTPRVDNKGWTRMVRKASLRPRIDKETEHRSDGHRDFGASMKEVQGRCCSA